jgi:hypothetical protein|tara:strand:- start:387 stop:557 length:171 start_codon:yes stop_codon:yes gene_type:complete
MRELKSFTTEGLEAMKNLLEKDKIVMERSGDYQTIEHYDIILDKVSEELYFRLNAN